ncbi:MAG: putative DNA binding domain-containing protein [Candidatus Omnitrophica bacterium]|nr:putative DNA binding domain-containing protein [Candidatus Omnitrophota bacterium]
MKTDELKLLIAEGEGLTVEFKEKYTTRIDRDMVALANAKGGFIVLGVDDNGKIIGERLTNQMKADILSLARNCDPHINIPKISRVDGVVVIKVLEGDEKPYSCSSGYFRRLDAVTQKMVQKEVRGMFRETSDKLYEDLPSKECSLSGISIKKVRAFLEEAKTKFKVGRQNLGAFLSGIGVYKNGFVNNACVLMFAQDVARLMPHAEIICGAFKGINKTYIYDRKDVRSDLLTQLNETMAFIQRQLNIRSEIRGLNRIDIYELPLDALREALVNAIIHRDYSFKGSGINVDVYDDRVEIVNPGGLPQGLGQRDFGKLSVRRNLIIADLFHRMGKVERIGSGIGRMRDMMLAAKLEPPKFEIANFFRAIFYRNPEYSLKKLPETKMGKAEKAEEKRLVEGLVEGLVENQRKMIDFINKNPRISKKELSDKIGISTTAIDKNIAHLKKKGLLRRVGPDKGGHWEVVK